MIPEISTEWFFVAVIAALVIQYFMERRMYNRKIIRENLCEKCGIPELDKRIGQYEKDFKHLHNDIMGSLNLARKRMDVIEDIVVHRSREEKKEKADTVKSLAGLTDRMKKIEGMIAAAEHKKSRMSYAGPA